MGLHPVRAFGLEYVPIPFSFAWNGSSAIAASSIRGENIASVTRTDVGEADVVLRDKGYEVIGFTPSISLDTAVATLVVHKFTPATKTLSLTVMQETAAVGGDADTKFQAADISAHADNRIGGVLWVRKSSVGK